jgi:hypothetical protein
LKECTELADNLVAVSHCSFLFTGFVLAGVRSFITDVRHLDREVVNALN